LCLPENYELISGTKCDTIYLYYELIKVTAVDTAYGIKLILEVPLKTESQHFTLFRIIALPTRVLNEPFALYQLEYNIGLSYSQRYYILMTAADVQKCSTGSIAICPADRALYDIRSITCESKLYFQTAAKDGPCRSLLLHYEIPTLLRHGEVWIYQFPSQRPVTIRFPRDHVWVTRTITLSGAGLIHNATTCSITSGEIRTLPELRGVTHAKLDTPSVYVPDNFSILSRHELPVSKRHSIRGQRTGPSEGPSCNSAEISRCKHPGSHPEDYISSGNSAALAPDTHRSFLYFHDPVDPLRFSPVETLMLYIVLSAHR